MVFLKKVLYILFFDCQGVFNFYTELKFNITLG